MDFTFFTSMFARAVSSESGYVTVDISPSCGGCIDPTEGALRKYASSGEQRSSRAMVMRASPQLSPHIAAREKCGDISRSSRSALSASSSNTVRFFASAASSEKPVPSQCSFTLLLCIVEPACISAYD